jgi:nitrogen regulatory protein P-II 1
MQMIEAVIKPGQLDAVKAALAKYGILGVTAIECKVIAGEQSTGQRYRGVPMNVNVFGRILLKVCVKDYEAEPAVQAIRHAARTGNPGDGNVVVSPITEAVRIRTGDKNDAAL